MSQSLDTYRFEDVIGDVCNLAWSTLNEDECVHAAWAYYFFSIQFRENLRIARGMFPTDARLARLEQEECDTSNLSPWSGVAQPGEALNDDEFMRRVLDLAPLPDAVRREFTRHGAAYLAEARQEADLTRALSLASYEDGGLEQVFRAILRSPAHANPVVAGFRHFLSEHIRFDSDPEAGHGAMIRHLRPDDRILPLWTGFHDLLVACVPALASGHGRNETAV